MIQVNSLSTAFLALLLHPVTYENRQTNKLARLPFVGTNLAHTAAFGSNTPNLFSLHLTTAQGEPLGDDGTMRNIQPFTHDLLVESQRRCRRE